MANAKIEFTIGGISFSGEGEEVWLAGQLDKIIDKVPELVKVAPAPRTNVEAISDAGVHGPTNVNAEIAAQTLPNFLKQKNPKTQVDKFLATAIWLHARGNNRLTTRDIAGALRDSNQSRFGNPSDMLAKNIAKGCIEREGKQFFVTDEGRDSL
ncbi:MAG: hypothetical protein HYX90_06815 [Chloroflexi bacterium]|nr:hypothetical protein [Chloroflexota bacterium]